MQPHGTQPRLPPAQPGCNRPLPRWVLTRHRGATCRDISFATKSCRAWKRFAKPRSLAGEEARAEGPGPRLEVPPAAPVGATQKPFPKQMSLQQHRPQKEGACLLQHTTAEELRFPCTAQSRLPLPEAPGAWDGDGAAGTDAARDTPGPRPVPRRPSQGAKGKTPSHYNSSR